MLRVKTTVADISLEACGARSLSRRRRRRRAHDRDPVLKTPAAAEKSRIFIALELGIARARGGVNSGVFTIALANSGTNVNAHSHRVLGDLLSGDYSEFISNLDRAPSHGTNRTLSIIG